MFNGAPMARKRKLLCVEARPLAPVSGDEGPRGTAGRQIENGHRPLEGDIRATSLEPGREGGGEGAHEFTERGLMLPFSAAGEKPLGMTNPGASCYRAVGVLPAPDSHRRPECS